MLLPLLESYNALGKPAFIPISTKEELEKRLDVYRGILAPSAREYLDSLVNLEFSVLRNDIISEKDRYSLSQLDIFKSIAQFNVYNRAINIFKNQKGVKLYTNENACSGVYVTVNSRKNDEIIYVFDHDDKNNEYGSIKFARIKENDGEREKEIEDLKRELRFTSVGNLKPSVDADGRALVGANSMAYAIYETKVKALKDRIEKLENTSSLSAADKRIMELTNHLHDLILEDYGLELDEEGKRNRTTVRQKVLAPHFDVYRYTLYK